jgi:hypothetical protein
MDMRFSLIVLLLVAAAWCAAQHFPFDKVPSAVIDGKDAVVLMPAQAIGNNVLKAEWSPTGQSVLMVRTDPIAKKDIVPLTTGAQPQNFSANIYLTSWNRQTKRSMEMGTVRADRFNEPSWFRNQDVAIGFLRAVTDPQTGRVIVPAQLYWASTITGRLTMLAPPVGNAELGTVEIAERANLALMAFFEPATAEDEVGEVFYLLADSTGRLLATIRQSDLGSKRARLSWAPSGKNLWLRKFSGPRGQPPAVEDFIYDPYSKRLTPLKLDPGSFPDEPEPEEQTLKLLPVKSPAANQSEVQSLMLLSKSEEQPNRALVSGSAVDGAFAVGMDAILYREFGVVMVRELARLPKDVMKQAKLAAEKSDAMIRAKQVGLSIILYGTDYDDELPTAQDFRNEMVYPYAKNRSLFDGFVYTFRGGSMADVEDPSKAELGYVEGPGGRAVIRVDGSVIWVPYTLAGAALLVGFGTRRGR